MVTALTACLKLALQLTARCSTFDVLMLVLDNPAMRTTLTLEPDVEQLLREAMYRQGKTLKDAVNDGLRQGLRAKKKSASAFKFPTVSMGKPLVDLSKANALVDELEDQELLAKLRRST